MKTDWISSKRYIVGEKFFMSLNKSIVHSVTKSTNYNFNISANIVSDAVIKKLNQVWRQEDKTTDVLSFPYNEDKSLTSADQSYIGEVVISWNQAKRQAVEHKHSLRSEIAILYIHGVLHILGYDHYHKVERQKMYSLQAKIFEYWKKIYA